MLQVNSRDLLALLKILMLLSYLSSWLKLIERFVCSDSFMDSLGMLHTAQWTRGIFWVIFQVDWTILYIQNMFSWIEFRFFELWNLWRCFTRLNKLEGFFGTFEESDAFELSFKLIEVDWTILTLKMHFPALNWDSFVDSLKMDSPSGPPFSFSVFPPPFFLHLSPHPSTTSNSIDSNQTKSIHHQNSTSFDSNETRTDQEVSSSDSFAHVTEFMVTVPVVQFKLMKCLSVFWKRSALMLWNICYVLLTSASVVNNKKMSNGNWSTVKKKKKKKENGGNIKDFKEANEFLAFYRLQWNI